MLLAAADTALYQAKRSGRNRVEAAEELPLSLENWRRKTAARRRCAAGASGAPPEATALDRGACGNLSFTIPSISLRSWTRSVDTNPQAALMSLEAAAASARGGFACMFSTSDEYETALITERRAQGRYDQRRTRWPAIMFVGCALIVCRHGAAVRLRRRDIRLMRGRREAPFSFAAAGLDTAHSQQEA